MIRDLSALQQRAFDLVVVGGGIYGACAAWEAAHRGLSVALIDQGDFGHATSANSYKIVHGGMRYLQQADLTRLRQSSRERSALLRIAPHLVHPLPIVVPTYGHGRKGKELLATGLYLYDVLTWDRNRRIRDGARRLPPTRPLSRAEVLRLFPGVQAHRLTGGLLFHDAQMYNPPRLTLAFLQSAARAAAQVANYVQAVAITRDGDRATGVQAQDLLTGSEVNIRARLVLNAAGPWAAELLARALDLRLGARRPHFSRDVGLVVRRRPRHTYGLACAARSRDADAIVHRGSRHLFVLPWRDHTLVGVWHQAYTGPPDDICVSAEELGEFVAEANTAYPGLRLKVDEVSTVNTGLILFGDGDPEPGAHRFGSRSMLIDHARDHGLEGLITVIGVRATTARDAATAAVNLAGRKLGRQLPPSRSATLPLWGGDLGSIRQLSAEAARAAPPGTPQRAIRALVRNYGTRYRDVLRYAAADPELAQPLGTTTVLAAEVVHAVREEMALTLADIVLRRTDLGTAGHPGEAALRTCAELVGGALSWSLSRCDDEIEQLSDFFSHRGAVRHFAARCAV